MPEHDPQQPLPLPRPLQQQQLPPSPLEPGCSLLAATPNSSLWAALGALPAAARRRSARGTHIIIMHERSHRDAVVACMTLKSYQVY